MLYAHCGTQLPIVGVGGISDVESAWEKNAAGASLFSSTVPLCLRDPVCLGRLTRV